jgi:hypothetical protein
VSLTSADLVEVDARSRDCVISANSQESIESLPPTVSHSCTTHQCVPQS